MKKKTKKFKYYTPEQRAEYHSKRVNSKDISNEKRMYSRNWLEGYNDSHAEFNLKGSKIELEQNRKYANELKETVSSIEKNNKFSLGAYIKGLEMRVANNKRK